VSDRLLVAAEVADLLQVPESWVRQEARVNRIPHLRLGRYVRFDEEAVLAWLEGQRAGQWRKNVPRARPLRDNPLERSERETPGGSR
jgi:excisionase family DNA binding protein